MSSIPPTYYYLFLIWLSISPLVLGGENKPLVPALYVLGDSILDSGNNNNLATLARANYPPYGVNFNGVATGRFTDGKTSADFIAEFLGLPLAPPYLSKRESLPITGLNYASGSCGILPESGSIFGKCLKFEEQINLFENTVKSELPNYFHSSNELSKYLSKSIFLVSIGTNDYGLNYLQPKIFDTSKRYNPYQFAQLLTNLLSHYLERLYKLGARKVVVFEQIPIGCSPFLFKTRQEAKETGGCYQEGNDYISIFNNRLPRVVRNLTSNLKGSIFVLARANHLETEAISNPSKYGLNDGIEPCCPSLLDGALLLCKPLLKPCPNPEKSYNWDGIHLTQAVYSLVAKRCINDNTFCLPYNIKELVEK